MLAKELWTALKQMPHVRVYGQEFTETLRSPTIAFTVKAMTAVEVCSILGSKGIFAWDGHFYAIRAAEILNVLGQGGVIRMGIVGYNTHDEIAQVIDAIRDLQ
jgi:selenocysteine lyase/cysteine desulfurase